jgi:hypothetical protein
MAKLRLPRNHSPITTNSPFVKLKQALIEWDTRQMFHKVTTLQRNTSLICKNNSKFSCEAILGDKDYDY